MPELATAQDLALAQKYVAMRDAPRLVMATGVYPNSVKALEEYQNLIDWLDENPDYETLHGTITSQVAPYIAQMQTAMQSIITIMQAIETAAPGAFGIELPAGE